MPSHTTTTIRPWVSFLDSEAEVRSLYETFPGQPALRLQSLNCLPSGPTLLARVDLASFPEKAPSAWVEAGCDTVQLTLEFLAVEDFSALLAGLPGDVEVIGQTVDVGKVWFTFSGDGVDLRFRAYERLRAGHVSAYRRSLSETGEGSPRHLFLSKVDSMLYRSIPDAWVEPFHGKL